MRANNNLNSVARLEGYVVHDDALRGVHCGIGDMQTHKFSIGGFTAAGSVKLAFIPTDTYTKVVLTAILILLAVIAFPI